MKMKIRLKKTSYLWLFFACAGLLATAYLTYHYFSVRDSLLDKAREYGRQKTINASQELSSFIMMLKPLADSVAQELSEREFSKEELEQFLAKKKPDEITGLGVAFLPYKFDRQTKLYAPYVFEREGKNVVTHLEKSYDYTLPENTWFAQTLKRGSGFIEPYYGKVTKTIVADYQKTFYYTDANGKKYPAGIVYATQSVEHLKHVLDTLFLGKTGYWFMLTKKGFFLSHPQSQLVHKRVTIFDLAKRIGNTDLENIGNKIIKKEKVFFEYDNELTGAPSWLFSEPIAQTNWSIVGIFDKNELNVNPDILRRNLILPVFAFVLFCIMSILFFISLFNDEKLARWWFASFIISLALAGLIVWIWYATSLYPGYQHEITHRVANKRGLYAYLKEASARQRYGIRVDQDIDLSQRLQEGDTDILSQEPQVSLFEQSREALQKGFADARFIPTGIFINNLQFVSANEIQISAYVWQRFTEGLHDEIPRGPMFPQAFEVKINEVSRIKYGDTETILWEVYGKLSQFLQFDQYPFDTKALRIQLWHRYSKENIVLVPDLNAYQLINPRSLPGIDDDVYLPGWNLVSTHFGYKMVNYASNLGNYETGPFGVYSAIDKSEVPELFFDILVTRRLLDTVVSDFLPISVIAFLLFVILLTSVQQGYALLGYAASVFFATVIAHVRFRAKIPQAQLVYFESFYFMMYVAILAILLVTLLYQLGFRIPFIRYRENLLSKLLYWPLLFAALVAITMVYLY